MTQAKINRASDKRLREHIGTRLKMATVKIRIAASDRLSIPEDHQSLVFDDIQIDGELRIAGELVFI